MKCFIILSSSMLLASIAWANRSVTYCGTGFQVKHQHIIDNCGRQAFFNGVNVANRLKPYYPSAIGFDDRNMRLLQRQGFNLVRLGIFWRAIEPKPGQYNDRYLFHINQTIQQLARYHINVLIDFHQDAYSSPWGFGFPSWSALGKAAAYNIGFPLNFMCGTRLPSSAGSQSKKPKVIGFTVCHHWDHFWKNTPIKKGGLGVQDYYMQMLTHVARYFRQHQQHNILGYDLLNEPFPGSRWKDCVSLSVAKTGAMLFKVRHSKACRDFDKTVMTPFTHRAVAAIQKGDRHAIAFYEPEVFYDLGAQSHIGPLNQKNTVFNFHNYNKVDMRLPFMNIAAQVNMNDSAVLMSEFGASTLNQLELNTMLNLANQYQVSPIYWAYVNNPPYFFWVPQSAQSGSAFGKMPDNPRKQALVYDMSKPLVSSNVKFNKLHTLSRIYAPYVAGQVISITSMQQGKKWILDYKPIAGRQTQILIPPSLNMKKIKVTLYPNIKRKIIVAGRDLLVTIKKVTPSLRVKLMVTFG